MFIAVLCVIYLDIIQCVLFGLCVIWFVDYLAVWIIWHVDYLAVLTIWNVYYLYSSNISYF